MAANTFSVGTLKNRVAGFDPALASSLARIAKTGKLPETTRPQDEMIVSRNRVGMMGFFTKVVDESHAGECVEVFGWYASQDPAIHAPFLMSGKFSFGAPGKDGSLTIGATVDGRYQFVRLDGMGVVARENGRRNEYVALLKAWGISEADHRTRFDAHAAARKAAADAVAVAGADATAADGVVIRQMGTPTEGRNNDGLVQPRHMMSEAESSVGSTIAAINAEAIAAD